MAQNLGIIYKVASPSGKVYIGKTIRGLAKRKANHLDASRRENSQQYDTTFSKAIRKYGDSLKWEILFENVSEEDLNWYEVWTIQLLDSYKNGYNSTLGGEGFRGKFTEEHRKNLSISHKGQPGIWKGKKFSKQHRKNLSKNHVGMTGKNHSEEAKKKMSETKKGKKFTEEHKKNLSKAFTGRKVSPKTREKLRVAALRQWEKQRNGE